MKGEFTAVLEEAEEGGYWAYCPEVPGANGQGETVEEAKEDLAACIKLILQDRLEDGLRGIPEAAVQDTVMVA
ncbi:MAG: type II toxin-antitoxin system HicB family antitoxin [Verrucomicrobiota bacterium]